MKIRINRQPREDEEVSLQRLRYEPGLRRYILAYSDERGPRQATPEEVGDLAELAIHPEVEVPGALAAPLVVQLAVTQQCNLSCAFCYAELEKFQNDAVMTTEQVEGVLRELQEMGVVSLEWAGGEPLLRHDLLHLLDQSRQRGFKQSIITNGTAFSNEFLAFAARHLDCVQISIDDVGSHYDELKGGDFWELLVSNVRRAVANELPIVGSVVLTEFNVSRLSRIVEFMAEVGIRVVRLSWQAPIGRAGKQSLATYRRLVTETVPQIRVLQDAYSGRVEIYSLERRSEFEGAPFLPREFLLCAAGRTRLHVEWNGDAYPCPLLKAPQFLAGNVLEDGPWQAWRSNALAALRQIVAGPKCGSCTRYCGYWCRAIAYGFSGNIEQTPSPLCTGNKRRLLVRGQEEDHSRADDALGEQATLSPEGSIA